MNISVKASKPADHSVEVLFLSRKDIHPQVEEFYTLPQNDAKKNDSDIKGVKPSHGDISIIDGYLRIYIDFNADKNLSNFEKFRLAGFNIAKTAQSKKIDKLFIMLENCGEAEFHQLCLGFYYGSYNFDKYKSASSKTIESALSVVTSKEQCATFEKSLRKAHKLMNHIDLARNLVNEPGSDFTPADFVEKAKELAQKQELKITIRDEGQLEKESFYGLLTVGKGSPHSPAMVTLEYRPSNAVSDVHLGIVGKGLTFDTGGISIKPSTDMWEMKMDMAGAAATLAAMGAIAEAKIPLNVTAVLCIAENRPGRNAVLPGDIYTAKNGKTVMVDNTDAEGRLVLTDGLWEAGQYGVTHLVNLATLTGAIIRALGEQIAGLFSNSQQFTEQIMSLESTSGESFWPMPMPKEYAESLKDKVADLKNIGGIAGSITAALFLQEFIPANVHWAHWDIAGTAFNTKKWKYYEHGGTGFGVHTLVQLAQNMAQSPQDFPPLTSQKDESDD
ncbi:MAG: leucyl aminopeptidase [Fibrobacter sp.]|nr:leucyl aminopeptidase [Fibrobacter sp.]